jgi:hypothetical protein
VEHIFDSYHNPMTCGGCSNITTPASPFMCWCGRMLCGQCGKTCKDHAPTAIRYSRESDKLYSDVLSSLKFIEWGWAHDKVSMSNWKNDELYIDENGNVIFSCGLGCVNLSLSYPALGQLVAEAL